MKFEEILECSKSNLLEEMRRKDLDAAKKETTRWKEEVQTKVDEQDALKKEMIRVIQGTSGLDREMIQQMVKENASQAANQIDYTNRYNALVDRYENMQLRYDSLQAQKQRRQLQAAAIDDCLTALEEIDLLQIQFSDVLWHTVVDHVTVCADGQLVFLFKNSAKITTQL